MNLMPLLPSLPEMQRAFAGGDASYDGIFWTGVRTTGIFCKPSCGAKKPRAENIEFFATIRDAVFAGYRPCMRCRPLEINGSLPDWLGPVFAELETAPESRISSKDLSDMGVDPSSVRRWFKAHYGMSFSAYCRARRLHRALNRLRDGTGLDDVALDSGFESHSGFRDAFGRQFGTSPGRSGDRSCLVSTRIESPVGSLIAVASDEGICLLEFTDRQALERQLERVRLRFGGVPTPGDHPMLERLKKELTLYFAGELREFKVPLVTSGTPFQERVWHELCRIPYGTTISYEELAGRAGRQGAQRAVGLANGMNRICIVIPCHRVVNKSGELGGYGGGLWRKRWLINLEMGVPISAQNCKENTRHGHES